MDAFQKMIMGAGQRVHEDFFGAVFSWNQKNFPCTHGEVMKNPPLITGGFSPNTEVQVVVRDSLFGDATQLRPKKGDVCSIKIVDGPLLALQIATVMTTPGAVLQKYLCSDVNQEG